MSAIVERFAEAPSVPAVPGRDHARPMTDQD